MDGENPERSAQAAKERVTRERGSPVLERSWEWCLYAIGLKDKEKGFWEGKVILDVGSGKKGGNPADTFPGAKVCAVDPEFLAPGEKPPRWTSWFHGRILESENTAHEKRWGAVQEIPYDDDKFDLVFSTHAVPQHIMPVDMPRAVLEMLRVMKPTGEVRLVPCVERDIGPELKQALEESGFESNIDITTRGLTVLRAGEAIRGDAGKKREAWKALSRKLFPTEELAPGS